MKITERLKTVKVGENMVYSLVWIAILLIPIMNAQLMSEKYIDFNKVIISWGKIAPYFLIFIVNNNILAPKFLLRKRYIWYSLLVVAMVTAIFVTIDILDFRYWQSDIDLRNKASFTDLDWYWNILLGIFMVGANSMIKLYYIVLEADKRMIELERQNIETQMEYLKYQINPHFLMNTLNNIHAMIDFDSEMAKTSIMELSRMLRHVLYDSGEKFTSLKKEVDFLKNYIELMRIRYVDEVAINFSSPTESVCHRIMLPPLLIIVLVENAFKHGISYNKLSYINIEISIADERLKVYVENSNHPTQSTQSSGIGFSNVTKRLKLLFGENYTLDIETSSKDKYQVTMIIPVTKR